MLSQSDLFSLTHFESLRIMQQFNFRCAKPGLSPIFSEICAAHIGERGVNYEQHEKIDHYGCDSARHVSNI